jgi:hypothetical protein
MLLLEDVSLGFLNSQLLDRTFFDASVKKTRNRFQLNRTSQGLYYVSAAEPEAVGEGSDKFPSKSTRVTIPTSVGLHPQASSGYPFPQRKVYQKPRFQDSALCRQISMGPKSDSTRIAKKQHGSLNILTSLLIKR